MIVSTEGALIFNSAWALIECAVFRVMFVFLTAGGLLHNFGKHMKTARSHLRKGSTPNMIYTGVQKCITTLENLCEAYLSKAMGWALGHSSEALKNSLQLEDPVQSLTCRPPVQCEEQRLSGGSKIRTDLFDIPKGASGSEVVLTNDPDTRWWYVISCDPANSSIPMAPTLPE